MVYLTLSQIQFGSALLFSRQRAVNLFAPPVSVTSTGNSRLAAFCFGDNMKEIPLTQGKVAKVSDHRFEYLNQWEWCASQNSSGKWYAQRSEGWPLRKTVLMHRQIAGVTDSRTEVDHKDNDGLNNQDDNLRVCTGSQNQANKGRQKNNTSGYKGVTWDKQHKKYKAALQVNGKTVHLGHFADPVDAARAYDDGAKRYHGEFAYLNFPNQ